MMKNLIIYKAQPEAKQEIDELLHNKGSMLFFVDSIPEFISVMENNTISEAYVYVKGLSDIRLLNIMFSLNYDVKIVLVVSNQLHEIINILRNDSFIITTDIVECLDMKTTNRMLKDDTL